jgi:hypothetical protein
MRGPQHIVRGDKPPMLDPAEARVLLDSRAIVITAHLKSSRTLEKAAAMANYVSTLLSG